ncbi:hypothetical protein APR41_06860 [Salegentibacter salinarum]|uniref:Uncharacterized protein n=1 Tax=Salegentibacter salinarum TaxID=447422 RepID=A0A2N0TR24_9FLAO|nr:hypothetical protein [Salegentibacter salinarum]PKD17148.1 hypothetical protein APR41_06860 [Salegentibacter salinarum]SKB55639.1 hypothetical protein SAMN05660903_01398 [Salegentibacter salinarum]
MKPDREQLEALEPKRVQEMRNLLILHYHQESGFFERRIYIMFFIISGIGLYTSQGTYQLYQSFMSRILLSVAASLFLLGLVVAIVSHEFARKTRLQKADYFNQVELEKIELYRKSAGKYEKIEDILKIVVGVLFLISCILIGIVYVNNGF